MRTHLLAAAAAIAIAAPAYAQPSSGGYVGLEGGVLFPQDTKVDSTIGTTTVTNAYRIHNDTGYDLDGIAGYDFGLFRLEGELGYKHSGIKSVEDLTTGTTVDSSDHVNIWSAMLNGLVDFDAGGVGIYAGGGVGHAWVNFGPKSDFSDSSDDGWAYQLIAGAYVPVSSNVDLGLKYRYFQTERLHFAADPAEELSGRFRSHSVLASLTYHFGAPAAAPAYVPAAAPPPPPPAPAPATQTCPDGTVILATETCPAPPPPPPPPPPPSPGERG